MKKVILIPDSFKGTMDSAAICGIMEKQIKTYYPEAETVSIPVADGGEGTVDAFLAAMGGEKVFLTVKGPYREDLHAFYGLVDDGRTAIIEMASCAGLPLVGDNKHAERTTTYGVGQLIAHAAESGCRKIIVGLGGSATNDGGTGAASALGIRFLDYNGNSFVPVGGTLDQIQTIDMSGLCHELKDVEIVTMCDIDNSLCGSQGASAVFGPQKGADEDTVKMLDQNLAHLAEVIHRDLKTDIADLPGAGAAGGMGAGMVAFLGSSLQMGIETVLDTVRFDEIVADADLVISGEGKMDTQSLRGKVVIGVAHRAKAAGVPVIAVVGDIGDNIETAYDMGVTSIFSINRVAVPFKEAKMRSQNDLALTVDDIVRLLKRTHF
ncbi:glycerate kinase family protein [Caproiciproducens sp. R1]|uniref:glycerate kinase family protein n=1 Tax=Caproiciproducens sp. R1 TaxID=3435000 RepID=UPI004034D817